jgi:hypothetical protein
MHFEFSDSEVAQCTWEDGHLQLRFAAARLIDTASRTEEAVWAPLLLTAQGVEPWDAQAPVVCMGRLRQGYVLHDSQRMARLPVPCALEGIVNLELEFDSAHVVRMRCEGLSLHPLQAAAVSAYQC